MWILIALAIATVVGLVILAADEFGPFGFVGFMMAAFGGVGLIVGVAFIPLNRMAVNSSIAEFNEVMATAERMRDRGDTWESAAFQTKVADRNAWLASTQYYNGTAFDLWIPDAVEDMKPIE